jgi:invasion protein IalB
MHAWIQQERFGVMRRQLAFAFFCGSRSWPVDRPSPRPEAILPAKAPEVTIAGNFSQWALVCGKEKDKEGREPCSLVQALVQRETQKLVFRVTVAYGPQGNLVLRIDGPTGARVAERPRILARCHQDLSNAVSGLRAATMQRASRHA